MGSHSVCRLTLSRAWSDTKSSLHKIYFFWLVEVIATGLGVFIGTVLTPEDSSSVVSAIYPVSGGIIGVLVGFFLIFIFNLVLAPYRLLREASERVLQLEKVREGDKKQTRLKDEIGALIIEGTAVLRRFKSIRTFGAPWPVEEFEKWRDGVFKTLDENNLDSESSLFFRDVYLNEHAVLNDFVQACEAGLYRLEEILQSFHP